MTESFQKCHKYSKFNKINNENYELLNDKDNRACSQLLFSFLLFSDILSMSMSMNSFNF